MNTRLGQRLARWLFATLLVLNASSVTMNRVASAAESPRKPNVILVLMDDMGWNDVGFMGNKFAETPHLDRLAREGVVFSQAYASAPNCAPTRACLMSGQYTPRHGVYTVVDPRQMPGATWHKAVAAESRSELSTEIVTIAEALADNGYATAFFGMWNLGRGRRGPVTPGGQGFQHVVFPENLGFAKDAYHDDDGNYLSDRLTDAVLKFIDESNDRPFFVYFADHAIHAPFDPKPELRAKYEAKAEAQSKAKEGRPAPGKRSRQRDTVANADYAATVEAVDQNIGRLMQALERRGLHDNTVVLFTSDNGGTPTQTLPLRGGKGELYEGGLRVPLVMRGPGIGPPGSTCSVPVVSMDLYPTLLALTGSSAPAQQPLDGVSLLPLLHGDKRNDSSDDSPGEKPQWPARPLYWHFPSYAGRGTPSSALRFGDFKLIEFFEGDGRLELYNLSADPGESRDLAEEQPDRTAEMARQLRAWQRTIGAAIPQGKNPAYDPQSQRPRGRSDRP